MVAVDARDIVKVFPGRRLKPFNPLHPFAKEKVHALRDVSFRADWGLITGILGPNGAGKTTLMKILCGLIVPTTGKAIVGGIDLSQTPAEVRSITTYIPSDERSFYLRLSLEENLDFFGRIYGLEGETLKRKIREVLEVVGLWERREEWYGALSSGLKQRMSLARGLLKEPKIMLMDEPTKGLDPKGAMEIRNFVKEHLVGEKGITVLWASHDLHEVEEICSKVIILNKGQVTAQGSPEDLKGVFHHRELNLRLSIKGERKAATIALKRALSSVSGVTGVDVRGSGGEIEVTVTYTFRQDIVYDIMDSVRSVPDLSLTGVSTEGPSLEDAFMRVIDDGLRT